MSITTSIELWQGWDSETPLDTNVLCTQHIGDTTVARLYFTGRSQHDCCSRVYGVVMKTSQARHALLVVNSPDRAVDEAELSFWADKGYIAMGIDYAGNSNIRRHTIYPHCMQYANYHMSDNRYMGEDDIGKWYEYSYNTMRAVGYLLSSGATKVSILSYGEGSRIATIALATDDRIDNGAILFGSLHEHIEYCDSELDIDSDSAQLQQVLVANEQLQRYELLYSPQSYVQHIKSPIYMLASGNSLYTDVLRLSDSYYRTNDNSCLMVLPDTLDYCHNGILDGVAQWLDNTVVQEIELSHTSTDGVLTISTNTQLPLDKLQLWYCRNGNDNGKHWNRTTLSLDDGGNYSAVVPLCRSDSKLLALVTYHGDIAVSSAILTVDIDDSYTLEHAIPVLYRGGTPFRFVSVSAAGEWHGMSNGITQTVGYLDIAGAKGSILLTFAGNDGSVQMGESDTIALDVCSDIRQQFHVMLIQDYGSRNIRYIANSQLVGDGKWQKIVLEPSDFRSSNGQAMSKDIHTDCMVFYADDLFIINNICMI